MRGTVAKRLRKAAERRQSKTEGRALEQYRNSLYQALKRLWRDGRIKK